MQRISRAPVLSATRKRDSCWITDGLLPYGPRGTRSSFGYLDNLGQAPVLRLGQRSGLDDPDDISHLGLILLVVGVEPGRAADDLLVLRMRLHRIDAHDDGLVHRARDDNTPTLLAASPRMLGLGLARDRLALGRPLAPRLRMPMAQRARQPLPLFLR